MTQEDKQLLLKDLCARLPYALQVRNPRLGGPDYVTGIDTETWKLQVLYNGYTDDIEKFKPYLRPMSSMTEEELEEFHNYTNVDPISWLHCAIDWLNANYFDYRGLIEKGLAIEAPEGMYE
jgi:hypothetical protein